MSNDYILFYSNRCLHSKELLNLLYKDVELNQKFIKINIDNPNVKLPPYVKSVPTAIVPNDGQPSIMVGSNIFKWYQETHKNKRINFLEILRYLELMEEYENNLIKNYC